MRVPDRDVMRLFDGELTPEEARRLAAERLRDPSVDARLSALLQVAAFTRVWARERGVRCSTRAPRREWRRPLLALGGAAVALAALFVVPRVTAHGAGGAVAVPRALPAAAVAVEQVDFGDHDGTIFSVSAAGTETTVVWLSDDADDGNLAL